MNKVYNSTLLLIVKLKRADVLQNVHKFAIQFYRKRSTIVLLIRGIVNMEIQRNVFIAYDKLFII